MNRHFFIGIKAPTAIEETVVQLREKYKLPQSYKVIPHLDDLHITLFFIGALSEDRLPSLQSMLQRTAENHESFNLFVDGLSYFGLPKDPRVVYCSISPSDELSDLQRTVASNVKEAVGLEDKKPYTPHITIAKKRKSDVGIQIEKEAIDIVQFQVDHFSLFTIHPSKNPKYEETITFQLR
ncbi:RNA 2',3'-cyclic phosphodiesterase [Sporosarcina sp. USHLN248]|uniref:RNA 2',3'-cyclic phosphodiesterase n=1 Tax=Sporosarcina sp. USHLN248 TaxID=3081300 RepID=UPI00301981B5